MNDLWDALATDLRVQREARERTRREARIAAWGVAFAALNLAVKVGQYAVARRALRDGEGAS